jgi:hypothetical protein
LCRAEALHESVADPKPYPHIPSRSATL